MNFIFRLSLVLLSCFAFSVVNAQNPPQQVNANYQFKGGGSDSGGMRIPKYTTLPVHPGSVYMANGALAYQVSDSSVYAWDATTGAYRLVGPIVGIGGGDTVIGRIVQHGGTLTHSPLIKLNAFDLQYGIPSPGTGDNSGNIYEVKSPSGGSKNSNFVQLIESINAGQADTSHNEIMKWGWNTEKSANPNLPEDHYAMEFNYNPSNTGRVIENHLQLRGLDNVVHRLFSATTSMTANDSSISTSNWQFTGSKFDLFDIQGQQCISVFLNGGKSDMTWYWDQNIDETAVLQGWNSAGDTYNFSNENGGTKTLSMDGWNIVTLPSNDVSLATDFAFEKHGVAGSEAVCFLGNVYPSAIVPDTLSIGNVTSNWRESHIKNGYFKGSLVAGDQTAADATAVLDIHSTTQGFGPPSMTTVNKLAIVSPREGLQVYDNTLHQMSYYNGTSWVNF